MDESVLLGIGHHTVPIPSLIWHRQVQGEALPDFMTEAHHRIRNLVVLELPRAGEPLSPELIAQRANLPLDRVVGILDDLEQHMTFLFRNEQGAVEWAYPVTVAHTPHHVAFSTGERVNAA
jgi:hypothetical protein